MLEWLLVMLIVALIAISISVVITIGWPVILAALVVVAFVMVLDLIVGFIRYR